MKTPYSREHYFYFVQNLLSDELIVKFNKFAQKRSLLFIREDGVRAESWKTVMQFKDF